MRRWPLFVGLDNCHAACKNWGIARMLGEIGSNVQGSHLRKIKTPPNEARLGAKMSFLEKRSLAGVICIGIVVYLALSFVTTPKDNLREVAEVRKLAAQGNAEAQRKLGDAYFIGWGKKDFSEAQEITSHFVGYGVETDFKEAMNWWRKAADQGDARAQYELGVRYYIGRQIVKQNYEEAVNWWRKAAEKGYAPAQSSLGTSYAAGRGVRQDWKQAGYWWLKAANQGWGEAQFKLGQIYFDGKGVEKNVKEAVKWWRKAAEGGTSYANLKMVDAYVKKYDGYEESDIKYVQKEADGGNRSLQIFLESRER